MTTTLGRPGNRARRVTPIRAAKDVLNAVECDRCGAYVARGGTGRHDVFHQRATFAHDVFPDLATPHR